MDWVSQDERPRMVVTRALPQPILQRIDSEYFAWVNPYDRGLTGAEIIKQVEAIQADTLIVMAMDLIDASLIGQLPACLRTIATYSVGHDHIDLTAAKAKGIAVLSTPDVLSDAVAEIAVLVMLGVARRAHEGSRLIYSGQWKGWTPTQLIGRDVTGARLAVFGMGRIGRAIARKAGRGFDMKVHYHNRSRLPTELEDGATFHTRVESLLAVADFLVLAAPSTPETLGFLNEKIIAQLPQGAIVINVGRGSVVDDDALIAALRSGRIAGAGLDVFNNEPEINPGYLDLPNVFLQPHQGSSAIGTRIKMGDLLLDSVTQFRAGATLSNRLA
jgi:lactate dehydrogenase-like 2-hydroxyacid dehydrogenase